MAKVREYESLNVSFRSRLQNEDEISNNQNDSKRVNEEDDRELEKIVKNSNV